MELTSIKTIKELKSMFDFAFSKGLGQNFLTDAAVLDKIADAASGTEGVLEIGPGFGVLTKTLSENFEKVVSIEIDKSLLPVLDYTLAGCDNVKIINSDFMKLNLKELIKNEFNSKKISVAANLPYYITTPIITTLLEGGYDIENIVVMVQKEVAQRFCAKPGTKEYGAISVLCNYYTEPEIVVNVPAGSFYPAPKVDSAVVRMRVLDKPSVLVDDEKHFFKVVKASFAQRRKTLLNCLSNGFSKDKETIKNVLEAVGIDATIRGERLGVSDFAKISDEMLKNGIK
ncbi:MAG: 16S rRNA (adenine(1518)-N(6)/adenine(1519)-N(6))-dimethyltransferase RsmA [Clostridia bacterium]|nr:16S rRNA (adenine(1518)-N(6)/adenine(1519)-N(6))-dimethyltransferase RsmA [Clostridia bacterium]